MYGEKKNSIFVTTNKFHEEKKEEKKLKLGECSGRKIEREEEKVKEYYSMKNKNIKFVCHQSSRP